MITALKSIPTLLQGGIATIKLIHKESKDRACLKLFCNDQPCLQLLRSFSEAHIVFLDICFL
jgi:hypothetical protein